MGEGGSSPEGGGVIPQNEFKLPEYTPEEDRNRRIARELTPEELAYARKSHEHRAQEKNAPSGNPLPPDFIERADHPQFFHEPTEADDRRSEREFKVRALIKKANNMLRGLKKNAQLNQTSQSRPRNAMERADDINR
jgi:hypothetical protein